MLGLWLRLWRAAWLLSLWLQLFQARLYMVAGLGMNFVRHHSHILPIEYFDAACEVGIMISAEFP